MRKLKVLSFVMITCIFAIIIGCSDDSIIETADEEKNLTQTKDFEDIDKGDMTVLITYVEGLPEADKIAYREFYEDIKVLLHWKPCEEDINSETWTVNCGVKGYQCRNGNPPTDRDKPVPGQTERMLPNADCEGL